MECRCDCLMASAPRLNLAMHPGGNRGLIRVGQLYSVKVKQFDNDHKRLFALINDLHDAMMTGKGAQVIQRVIRQLAEYTKYHFSGEEALLERTKYASLEPHRVQHREFVSKVEQFERDLKRRSRPVGGGDHVSQGLAGQPHSANRSRVLQASECEWHFIDEVRLAYRGSPPRG